MKNTTKNDLASRRHASHNITRAQEIVARCAYLGARARFYGVNLHLDFMGGSWPTTEDDFDLGQHVAEILEREGEFKGKVVAKNYRLVRPQVSTDPSALDLSGAAYEAQRRTI